MEGLEEGGEDHGRGLEEKGRIMGGFEEKVRITERLEEGERLMGGD